MRMWVFWAAVASLSCAACASRPAAPGSFNPSQVALVKGDAAVEADAGGTRKEGAAKGAGAGGGGGLVTGAVICALLLPLGPLAAACLPAVLPTTLAVGTATGAVVGAGTADDKWTREGKQLVLTELVQSTELQGRFAGSLQQQARDAAGLEWPMGDAGAPGWKLVANVTEVSSAGSGQPYALRLDARVVLQRAGEPGPAFEKAYVAVGTRQLYTTDWQGRDVATAELDALLGQLSAQVVKDLAPVRR